MTTTELDPVFASALRGALVAHVEGTARQRRRWRWGLGLGLLAGTGVLAGGVAVAATLLSAPGGTVTVSLAVPVTVTRTGAATVALGSPPKGTTAISWTLTCLSAGSFTFPGGAIVTCSAGSHSSDVQPMRPGQTSITVATGPTVSWELRAEYVKTVATPFGVNAKGETYGVSNSPHGTPDLQVAPLSAGVPGGYLTTKQFDCASGGDVSNPTQAIAWDTFNQHTNTVIPVYESDGTTVIGHYVVGPSGPGVRTVPLSTIAKRFCTSTRTPSTTVVLPGVVGEPEATAANAIDTLGLVAQETEVPSSTVPEGDVVAETPGAGAKAPKGALVVLTVSAGPPTGS